MSFIQISLLRVCSQNYLGILPPVGSSVLNNFMLSSNVPFEEFFLR